MRILRSIWMLSLAWIVLGSVVQEVRAGFTGITTDPAGGSIVVGYEATYTANVTVDPFPVASYTWQYMCNESSCAGNWTTAYSTSNQLTLIHGGVGSMTIQCTVVYQGVSNPDPNFKPNPRAPETMSVPMNVIGPDTIKLGPGSGVVTPFNQYVEFYWRPYAGGKILGPYVSPIVEENILRGGTWSGWSGADANFGWRSEIAAIDDSKFRGWSPPNAPNPFASQPNPLDTVGQKVRITIPKCCDGVATQLTVGTWTLTTNKTADGGSYTIDSSGGP